LRIFFGNKILTIRSAGDLRERMSNKLTSPLDANTTLTDNSLMETTYKKRLPSFQQIEQELSHSEVYQQAIAQWQHFTGTPTDTAKTLIDAIAKETMRVTFHLSFSPDEALETDSRAVPPQKAQPKQPRKQVRLSSLRQKAKPKNKNLAESRAASCHQIGRTIANARRAQNLSLEQIHVRTLIPLCNLRAIEEGNLDELPEDVYLRGFIRQVGNVLGLNGTALAATLPEVQSSVVPSWYRASSPSINMKMTSLHLYLGYTALVAGAVGGLSWLSQHNEMNASVQPDLPNPVTPSWQEQDRQNLETQASEQAAANVVPPETLNN